MKLKTTLTTLFFLGCFTIICVRAKGQFYLSGQLRTRSEYRDGQGAPLSKGEGLAFFTSQRTRLNFKYNMYRLKFGVSLQDVRVWGQDVSTINRTTTANNNGLMLHEAWAEILLTDTTLKKKALSLKIGRQELVYDDQRLLGNLDWLQQGRRHDAAVLKFETKSWMIHLAGAYNQNKELASGTIYNSTPSGNYTSSTNGGVMYKSMQFLYAGRKLHSGKASFIFLSDQFSKPDTNVGKPFKNTVWTRATTGFYLNNTFLNKLALDASVYYQFGKTPTGQNLSAALFSGSVQYILNSKIILGPGVDYTTGRNSGNNSHAFDPLYGTPHKFWGSMDYFYVASPFGKGGLTDYYLKASYNPCDKFNALVGLHQFSNATKIGDYDTKSFGQELDLVGSYHLTKQITLEGGYSHYWTTDLLCSSSVKNVNNPKPGANWGYLMINIQPDFVK
jgi:hypothetical protein